MTDPYSLPEWRAWVKAIRQQPDCDNLRLICADWLDEHGENERAELIRLQCHPRYREACDKPAYPLKDMPDIDVHCTTFANGNEPDGFFRDPCEPCRLRYRTLQIYYRWEKADGVRHTTWPIHFKGLTGQEVRAYDRGFVRLSRGPLSVLVGGDCRLCTPSPVAGVMVQYDFGDADCPTCRGTGRTPGVLRDYLDGYDRDFTGLWGEPQQVVEAQQLANVPPAVREEVREDGGYNVGHATQIIAFQADGVARIVYPFGTRQTDWTRDLPRLVAGEIPGE